MHLEGYGCAGMSATAYGLACLELEAGDSGIRSLVSVQGSLAMYAIHAYGSEEQRTQWLPRMAAGEAIGCFGLTEPDHRSDPAGMRTVAKRDGGDWVLNGTKMWITNGSVADVAVVWARTDDGIRGFVVPTDDPGVHRHRDHEEDVAARLGHQRAGARRCAAASSAHAPGGRGCRGRLGCLSEARFGIVFGPWAPPGTVWRRRSTTPVPVSSSTGRIGAFQLTQLKLADMTLESARGCCWPCTWGGSRTPGGLRPKQVSLGKLNNAREAIAIARDVPDHLGRQRDHAEYPVMRHANNLESVLTYEGTSEMHPW